MTDRSELRERATLPSAQYFVDADDWTTPVLIAEPETLAYKMARDGDKHGATRLFILVADLSQAKSKRAASQEDGGFSLLYFECRNGDCDD